jgi:hypothetical protein
MQIFLDTTNNGRASFVALLTTEALCQPWIVLRPLPLPQLTTCMLKSRNRLSSTLGTAIFQMINIYKSKPSSTLKAVSFFNCYKLAHHFPSILHISKQQTAQYRMYTKQYSL